jgi:hypothetical protein
MTLSLPRVFCSEGLVFRFGLCGGFFGLFESFDGVFVRLS